MLLSGWLGQSAACPSELQVNVFSRRSGARCALPQPPEVMSSILHIAKKSRDSDGSGNYNAMAIPETTLRVHAFPVGAIFMIQAQPRRRFLQRAAQIAVSFFAVCIFTAA